MNSSTTRDANNKSRAIGGLCLLGFLANFLHLSLSFGYDFLWGSIIALIAVWLYGPRWGAFAALVAASYTYLLWRHPWAIPIFVAEALFVGIVLRRKSLNILLIDALYWVVIGMPMVWLIYRNILQFDAAQTTVILLKDAVNGIFNALIASLIITYLHSHKVWNGFSNRASRHQTTSLANILFNLLVSCVLLPTMVFTFVDGRQARQRTDNDIRERLETGNNAITGDFQSWRDVHFNALQSLADLVSVRQMKATPEIVDQMALVYRTLPDLQHISLFDAGGQALTTYPEPAAADLPVLQNEATEERGAPPLPADSRPIISQVLSSKKGTPPTATISLPIFQNDKLTGHLSATLDLEYISRMLSWNARGHKLDAILVDRYNRVVASSNNSRTPGSLYEFAEFAPTVTQTRQSFLWTPPAKGVAPVQATKRTITVQQIPLFRLPWTLYLHAPYAPHQEYLQKVYTFNLAIMLTLSLCALLLAAFLSAGLARPLHQLAVASTNLPNKLLHSADHRPIIWPRSSVVEIDSLTRNFQQMAQTLRDQINDIQRARLDLAAESARLAEAHRLKDDFLAVLSHELRTPLVPILGYASLIATMPLKAEDTNDAAKTIERNARAQLRLIEDLLDVTSILSGKLSLTFGIANLRVVTRESIEALKPAYTAKKLNIVAELGETALQIPGDETRIRQIIWNLLSNAIKFTPADGTITIRLNETKDAARIEVTDTGSGIDGEFLPHVFDRFRQAEPHLTRSTGGLGLGLFIVQQLVELHGGKIEAFSDGLGHGTTFIVYLPLRAAVKKAAEAEAVSA